MLEWDWEWSVHFLCYLDLLILALILLTDLSLLGLDQLQLFDVKLLREKERAKQNLLLS